MGIFDKIKKAQENIKKSLEDKREQAKEDKINSDPELKALYAKWEKSRDKSEKDADDLMDKLGIDLGVPEDDNDDDDDDDDD